MPLALVRESHWADASAYWPLDRMIPPSLLLIQRSGLPGTKTMKCWSGWMEFGVVAEVASKVMSVKVRLPCAGSGSPAVVDRTTARALVKVNASLYWNDPRTKTLSGWPGGVAIASSYQHWPVQKS